MFNIITFGSATQDILAKPRKLTSLKYEKTSANSELVCLPLGSKIDIDDIFFRTGGGGTNTAATFANQGFKTAFFGAVGKDISGNELIRELKALKIDTKFVFTTHKKPTNHSIIILNDHKDRTILSYRGASEMLQYNDIPWKKMKATWMYLAPLSGLLCDTFEAMVDFAHVNHMKVAVNPGIAQLSLPRKTLEEIFKKIDVLILNQEEASFLTKIPFEKEQEIFAEIDRIHNGITVMTKGSEGVVVSDNTHIYSAKPIPGRKIVDPTGAGDAFGSGFVAEFIKSKNIEKAIQFGMANSAGCIAEIGAKTGLLKKGQEFEKVSVVKQ